MKRLVTILFFLIIYSILCAEQPFYAYADPLSPYIEGAKKEGSVTIGISLREKEHGKPAGQLYIAAFQKRYPFLNVSFKRIGGFRERERIITEMSAGIINFDVATVSSTMIPTIINAKLPRVVNWSELSVSQFFIHPENIGISLRTPVYGIAYNREFITDETAKTFTWETCTDPQWKGKIAMADQPRHLERLYLDDQWGREKTLDYAKRWAANKPVFEGSQTRVIEKLKAGAYHIVCGMPRNQVKKVQVYGESKSLGIVFPEPVPVGAGELIYVPEKSEHPNAAILFVAWTSTREAQNILDDVDFTGHPHFEGNEINEVLKGKRVVYSMWRDVAHADAILAELFQAMGMPVVRGEAKKKK